ncbi:CLUMA_CG018716, isoform A [Clunio marinus]|uniref:CLUMA_CG018716, isoform A n=1 Tax=Clunio marinus TaxID=568069 RepID=A0A1J1J1Q1_9DIPT|nr:CLUMA_CG018716, isoform A [Clunio marinus]
MNRVEIIAFVLSFHLRFVAVSYSLFRFISQESLLEDFVSSFQHEEKQRNAAKEEEIEIKKKSKMNPENHWLQNTNNRAESSS